MRVACPTLRATSVITAYIVTRTILSACIARRNSTIAVELRRPVCRDDRWFSTIEGRALFAIAERFMCMLQLLPGRCNVFLTRIMPLAFARPHGNTAASAVVTDAIDRNLVDHGLVIDVRDTAVAEVVDGTVVIEDVMPPVTAVIAGTGITVTVIDAAVEADLRSPVAGIENVEAVTP